MIGWKSFAPSVPQKTFIKIICQVFKMKIFEEKNYQWCLKMPPPTSMKLNFPILGDICSGPKGCRYNLWPNHTLLWVNKAAKPLTLGRFSLHHHVQWSKLYIQISVNKGSHSPDGRSSVPWSCKVGNLKTYNLSMSDPTQISFEPQSNFKQMLSHLNSFPLLCHKKSEL